MWTKGKWYKPNDCSFDGNPLVYCGREQNKLIAEVCVETGVLSRDEAEANARRIVKCVNSHDALVGLCKALFKKLKYYAPDKSIHCKTMGKKCECDICSIKRRYTKALALAEKSY